MSTHVIDSIFFRTNKPYVRWWWFNQLVVPGDIEEQLRWVADHGFGGVEIAWVYPLPDRPAGPRWLSAEWTDAVRFTKESCTRLGLGCDFTFGSLWPFGDWQLSPEEVSQWFSGASPQRIDRHWCTREHPGGPPVLNHLDRTAFESYAQRTAAALAPALSGDTSCLFCDSWEVDEEGKLWTPGFGDRFLERFGYRLEPCMPRLAEHPDERYDYRTLVAEYIIEEFYRPYVDMCRRLGALSRIQCHGAPTDIIDAYGLADIPESEALLFDPEFSRLAASAAAVNGKNVVSCEAFTCLYGWVPWPDLAPHMAEELTGDLRLLADALAANGVNRYVWHGMPFQAAGRSDRFYASVHVGPGGALATGMRDFNAYLETVSRLMREGKSAHRIACLLPLEDAQMKGELPEKLRKPSARFYWEFQHPFVSRALEPWSPLWVSGTVLRNACCLPDGRLRFGEVMVDALVVDSEYLDVAVLGQLVRLSAGGAHMIFSRRPAQPGRNKRHDFAYMIDALANGPRTRFSGNLVEALAGSPPFLTCTDCPEFFVREKENEFLLFAAHPMARGLQYPMEYGLSRKAAPETRTARFHISSDLAVELLFAFPAAGSCAVRIGKDGDVTAVDLGFLGEPL